MSKVAAQIEIKDRLLIGGEWVESERTYECHSPSNPSRVLAKVGAAGPEDVHAAYEAARAASLD